MGQRRRRPLDVVGVVALAVVVGVVIAGAVTLAPLLGAGSPVLGAPVTVPSSAPPAPAPSAVAPVAAAHGGAAPPAAPLPGQPLRIAIPAVGLDAPVGAMTVAAGGAVDPPTARSAYWLTGYGSPDDSANTVYLAGHTYRRGSAVFNPLLDVPHSAAAVHPGDTITLTTAAASVEYAITAVDRYDKATVEQQAELWRRVPGRLVLVTCFQYDGGTSSQQNLVVYAQRVG